MDYLLSWWICSRMYEGWKLLVIWKISVTGNVEAHRNLWNFIMFHKFGNANLEVPI